MNQVNFPSVNHVLKPLENNVKQMATPHEAHKSFSAYLNKAIEKVNDAQIHSDKLTEKLALGETVDLHEVMIAAQKANITMQATIEVRNKVIEAYQEIMRMQV